MILLFPLLILLLLSNIIFGAGKPYTNDFSTLEIFKDTKINNISFAEETNVLTNYIRNSQEGSKLKNEISRIFKVSLKKKIVLTLLKIDFQLFKLSQNKIKLFKEFSFRIFGWICGAFEIYVFLWVIGIDASLTDVVILESLTSLIKAFAFFIPGGLGVQELAFV